MRRHATILRVRILLGSLMVLMVAAGCAADGGSPPPPTSPTSPAAVPANLQAGQRWVLVWAADMNDPYDVTMTFGPGTVSGAGPVNRYSGPAQAGDDGSLQVGPIASTKMAGPDDRMAAEQSYFDALASADSWRTRNEDLTLLAGDRPVLRYGLPGSAAVFGKKLLGLSVAQAEARAAKRDYTVRVVSVNGQSRPMTMDYRPDRLNLYVEDGRVTQVTTG